MSFRRECGAEKITHDREGVVIWCKLSQNEVLGSTVVMRKGKTCHEISGPKAPQCEEPNDFKALRLVPTKCFS